MSAATATVKERLIPFSAGDGTELNLINVRGPKPPAKPPVLLVHGAGVRANIFRAPSGRTIVDELVEAGHDVWLENWRASIDIPHNRWTLDQAAVLDHPAAVRRVLEDSGADEVRAVIHCQGSTSFMMSAVAGLVPEVTTIVSNAVALHPVVSRLARLKMDWILPPAAKVLGYLNPQWGVKGAPWVLPKAITAWVRLTHHECDNDVCKLASYTYGVGRPTLWRHENLNAATHDLADPRVRRRAADLLRADGALRRGGQPGLGRGAAGAARGLHRSAAPDRCPLRFFAGELNACFLPESQRRTHAWFERQAPGRHGLHVVDRYGHLDVFMGKDAARDVFPVMLEELGDGR